MTSPRDDETILDADALKYMLGIPQGRRTIWGLLGAAGLFHQPWVDGKPDMTYFNCGRLNQGLILWADCLTVDPDHTAMMIKEQGSNDNSSTRSRSDADARSEPSSSRRKPGSRRSEPEPNSGIPAGLGLDRLTGRAFGDAAGTGDPTE